MTTSFFDEVAGAIERATSLERLEARGTLRLALKEAGLDPGSVSGEQMAVVMRKVMPKELESRGIADPGPICESIAHQAETSASSNESRHDSPEDVFQRLGG